MTSLQQVSNSYQTKRSRIVNVVITRQQQKIYLTHDIELCDVELVGGYGVLLKGNGTMWPDAADVHTAADWFDKQKNPDDYDLIETWYPRDNRLLTSKVDLWGNQVSHDTISLHIEGLDKGHHFMRDQNNFGNTNMNFLVSTDLGIPSVRPDANQSTSTSNQTCQAVHLSPNCTVHTHFTGSGPDEVRLCRFVADQYDEVMTFASNLDAYSGPLLRNKFDFEGHPILFYDDGGTTKPRYAGNSLVRIVLQFRVTPRTVL